VKQPRAVHRGRRLLGAGLEPPSPVDPRSSPPPGRPRDRVHARARCPSQAYDHALAWRAGALPALRWDTEIVQREDQIGTMTTVPAPARLGSSPEDAARIRDALLFEDGIEVQVHARDGGGRFGYLHRSTTTRTTYGASPMPSFRGSDRSARSRRGRTMPARTASGAHPSWAAPSAPPRRDCYDDKMERPNGRAVPAARNAWLI
jgi:hypothetical protein